ncbi:hypothetical protein [Streptomyces lavendulae]|nr:hypothetical protein [Streptomyces lavendulae]
MIRGRIEMALLRRALALLVDAGQWRVDDPPILVVLDAGHGAPRISHPLADLPVEVLGAAATAQAWDRLHPWLNRRAARGDHEGPLPVTEGTVIRLTVERLPSSGAE